MSQSALMRELVVTPGTISVRVDRLCARGLVTRVPDPHDRRSSRVTLTDAGRVLFERVTPGYLATEKRLLTALSGEQLDTLAVILRQLLVAFEGSTRDGTLPRLGLTLASSHHTVTMRRAVGLPEVVGLLVRDVERGSRAEHADIAVADASGEDTMTVSAVRGLDTEFEAALDLRPGPWDGPPPVAQESTGGDAGTHIV
jgi:MarR family